MLEYGCKVIVLMGVTGSGKTTVGEILSRRLNWDFYDADDFHPKANIDKMASGRPLEDVDRWPWLNILANQIRHWIDTECHAVLACSALKESYRRLLIGSNKSVSLVHLSGSRELIADRLANRVGHYMPANLLDSQFLSLELPEDALVVDISASPTQIAEYIHLTVKM